ncbi:trans-sulfuration enzyme family protein [Haliangium sp.]|uniref:trans-sulfuration enzyme family protein n=1 Tax=Haliangium sp. TaxID=2663208 RepID=UPI003D09B125
MSANDSHRPPSPPTPGRAARDDGFAPATVCAHAGPPRPVQDPRAHVTPLYQTSVFDFASIDDSLPALDGQGYVYARDGLPNADELGAAVAALEGAAAGVATSSGMGAITAAVLSLARAGDRIVLQRDAYGGSLALLERDLTRLGMTITTVDARDLDAFDRALADPAPAALALVESVSNPLLGVADLGALAARCRARGTALVCDNTFATPLRAPAAARPLALGVDLVVHSATKFLGGHGDLCAGVLVGDRERVAAARGLVIRMGLGAAPLDAWLAVRGLRTLDVRMQRAWATAADMAGRLAEHDAVHAVRSAERCALISVDLGTGAAARAFIAALTTITLSPSLGSVTTTASHPASSSHRALSPEARAAAGIGDGLVRLSIGLEAVDDLWRDIAAALAER